MENFIYSIQTSIQNDSSYTTFLINNSTLLNTLLVNTFNEEQLYGVSPKHKDVLYYEAVLFYKVILPLLYSSFNQTWNENDHFTAQELEQIRLQLKLKGFNVN